MMQATKPAPVPGDATLQATGPELWSALLDGELSDAEAREALSRLGSSSWVQVRLREYMALGDALRGLHGGDAESGFTDRVMAALEQEPTLLAPMRRGPDRRPGLWLAAAAVGAITWGLWSSLPEDKVPAPLVAAPANVDVQPYLAAHQDFAQAVIAPAEMSFTQVSLVEARP